MLRFLFLFSLSRKDFSLILHDRCVEGIFSLPDKCVGGILREKNGAFRPFSKVDEVVVYPYHLGEVAFNS